MIDTSSPPQDHELERVSLSFLPSTNTGSYKVRQASTCQLLFYTPGERGLFHSHPICHKAGTHAFLKQNLLGKGHLCARTSYLREYKWVCGERNVASVSAPHLHFTKSIIGHLVHETVEQSGWASLVHSELSLRGEVVTLLKTQEASSAWEEVLHSLVLSLVITMKQLDIYS